MPQPLKIAFPLGIGDCHWGCQKLAGLRERHPDREIHAFVNQSDNHKTVGYLEIVEHIDHAEMSPLAPYDINSELPPSYLADRWATCEGTFGWKTFDYVLVANGHVELGRNMDEYLPEVRTEYSYGLRIKDEDHEKGWALCPEERPVVLYPSGRGPNAGFHNHWWTPQQWVTVIRTLNEAGHMPYLIGANTSDDLGYLQDIEIAASQMCVKLPCRKLVGRTTIPVALSIIQRASVWCGLNSGTGIVSASQYTPTLMLWADRRYAGNIPGHHHPGFDPRMQRCWLDDEQLTTYRTLSYGSGDLTPQAVVDNMLALIAGGRTHDHPHAANG